MHKNNVVFLFVLLVISFFIFRQMVPVGSSAIQTISSAALYPLLRIQQKIVTPIVQWFEQRATVQQLQDQLSILRKQNEELSASNIALQSVCSYVDETKALRNFNKRYDLTGGQVAQVLVRHFSSANNFFLVDAGSTHGIKKDMVAIYCNALVGRVVEVYPWYCKVCLITDAECKVAAFCVPRNCAHQKNSRKKASGIHEGINDAHQSVVQFVSHLETVEQDSLVLSSGEGLIFPQGFALGKVIQLHKGDLFYSIIVKPELDFNTLSYCTLIAKGDMHRCNGALLLSA